MCLFFSARHINDLKHLYLLILLCLFWKHVKAEQSFQLNDFISTPWFLLNRDEPSADKNTRPDAFHIFHRDSLMNSELNRKVDLLVNPAIDSLAASGVSPASILALLYKPGTHAEGHTHHEVAVCVSSAPVVKKRVWAVSDNLPYPLNCEPLTAADNRHACKVRLDLNREHQVLAISGARFDSDCTQQLLLKTFSESPITKMAVVHYSRRTEQQAPSDQDNKKIQQELTGQFNPASLPFPPGEEREKFLLSGGGGGWDDFHDQGRRRPPWVFMQPHKLHVILPGAPLPSLFYDADASEDQNQELPAGWSVDSQQNRVTVHFEMNGAVHRLELDLDDWELLVQHGIARSPNLLYRVMVNMLRYRGQRKQLLGQLNVFLDRDNEEFYSLVDGILNELTELPPNHLLLATSLADLLVPAYENHLRQEAGWTLQKERPANTQWFYFNTLKTLAGLLYQRSAAEQALNRLWSNEGKRLILAPVGALLPDQMASLLRDQISYIAHSIITYLKAPLRQTAGWGSGNQGSGTPQDLPTTSSQQGATGGSGNGWQAQGGGQGGEGGDDKRKDKDRDSGQNRKLVTNPLTCSECHRELTRKEVKRLSRSQGSDKLLCRRCKNKDLPVKNEQSRMTLRNEASQPVDLSDSGECAICLKSHKDTGEFESRTVSITPCGYLYHKEWLNRCKAHDLCRPMSQLRINPKSTAALPRNRHEAVEEKGLLPVVKRAINKFHVDALNDNGETALMQAAREGNMEIVKRLIYSGANPAICTKDNLTAFDMAQNDTIRYHLFEVLVEQITALDIPCDNAGRYITHYLTELKRSHLSYALRHIIFDVNTLTTSLQMAFQKGKNDIAEVLIRCGANINAPFDQEGSTLLYQALKSKNRIFTENLMAAGANFLLRACVNEKKKVCEWAVKHLKDEKGMVADWVFKHLKLHEIKDLVHQGIIKVDQLTQDDIVTLSHRAVRVYNAFFIFDMLAENGVNLNLTDKNGETALHVAAREAIEGDDVLTTKKLIKLRVNVNATNSKGETALHLAAGRGFARDRVAALIEAGANVNARAHDGSTPLHRAAQNRRYVNADKLTISGTRQETLNHNGKTALQLAAENYDSLTVYRLLSGGGDYATAIKNGDMLFDLFAPDSLLSALKRENAPSLIFNRDFNPDRPCSRNGSTLLHYAIRFEDTDIIKKLLECGASTDNLSPEQKETLSRLTTKPYP